MKIAIVSTAALPAPPTGYGGLEHIAYDSATELAKLGNDVYLLTTNESTKIGISEAVKDDQTIGKLTVVPTGPTTWNYTGERDMFLNYHGWLGQEFGEGQGVIIDHSWWGYPYYLLTGGEITLDDKRTILIETHPRMKICHIVHGVTGWRKPTGEYVPPPGVVFPRIMGVSKTHAAYLSSCFKLPTRYVFNGVKIPDNLAPVGDTSVGSTAPSDSDYTRGYLLSLNRISKEKGIHNCIDVCLATKTPLKVVGDDQHVSDQNHVFEIMDRCARSGGLVEYVGTVDNERKWDYIRGSRGLIACPDPSNYVESFYMAAVEGWSQGKPIISLSNGGLADIVVDGLNGFLADNPGEMKEILTRGKEVFVKYDGVCNNGFDQKIEEDHFIKKTIKLEDLNPEIIKEEAKKYTIENMAKGYYDICKGIFENDPSYNW